MISPQRQAELELMGHQDAMKEHFASMGALQQHMSSPQALMDMGRGEPTDLSHAGTKQQFAPMIGGAIGAVGGATSAALTGGVGAPWQIAAGNALGSAAGELFNQVAGVGEEPAPTGGVFDLQSKPIDWGAVGRAGAIPFALSAVQQGLRFGHAFGPVRGPINLNAVAEDEAAIALGKIGHSRDLLDAAKRHFIDATSAGGAIPVRHTLRAIKSWRDNLVGGSEGAEEAKAAANAMIDKTEKMLTQFGNKITPTNIQSELTHYDDLIEGATGATSGAYLGMREALSNDLHYAADMAANAIKSGKFSTNAALSPMQMLASNGGRAAQSLVAARDSWMRGTMMKDIEKMIFKSVKVTKGQGLDPTFNAQTIINQLRNDKFFKKAMTISERTGLMGTLGILNRIAAIQPAQGVNAGSRRVLRGIGAAATVGGTAHYATSSPLITGAAALAGYSVPPLYETIRNLATAMQMQTGRELVVHLLASSVNKLTPAVSTILGAFTNSMIRKKPQPQPQQEGMMP